MNERMKNEENTLNRTPSAGMFSSFVIWSAPVLGRSQVNCQPIAPHHPTRLPAIRHSSFVIRHSSRITHHASRITHHASFPAA
jgi:hypothetical protein